MSSTILSKNELDLLRVLKAFFSGGALSAQDSLPEESWEDVFALAEKHLLLPAAYEVYYKSGCSGHEDAESEAGGFEAVRKSALRQIKAQYKRTAAFLDLYEYLEEKGICPLVIKGFVCRQTYPFPEYRPSFDEDLLIRPEEFDACHAALITYGMQPVTPEKELNSSYEVIYRDITSGLMIEIHRSLFPESSKAYGYLNRYFEDAHERSVPFSVKNDTVRTMDPDMHLFYLICHTFKHFLHFGAGLRQITDVLMFAKQYGREIDWEKLWAQCGEIHADGFAADIFAAGKQYLGLPVEAYGVPAQWTARAADTEAFLKDIFDSGMQARTTLSRIHSSNMTLSAVASEREDGSPSASVLKSLFPPYAAMACAYPYVEKHPVLLPCAWAQRIIRYGLETRRSGGEDSTSETLRIGNERIALFREMGILEKPASRKGRANENQSHAAVSGFVKSAGTTFMGGRLAPAASALWKGLFALEWKTLQAGWKLQGYKLPGPKERRAVRENVTFIYKSFERKEMAIGLYENIQKFYPGVRVIIADDSREPLKYQAPYLTILHLPFNSGLGSGIAAALEEVRTPFVMRMDDDELLTVHTRVGEQLLFLKDHPEVDIVTFGFITVLNHHPEKAVWPTYYETTMNDAPKKLKIRHMTRLDEHHVVLGKGPNIYLARTESIRKVGYDPNIRMIDHHEFFYRAAGVLVTVGATDCFVFHRHDPYDLSYRKYRRDHQGDQEYLRRKHGW